MDRRKFSLSLMGAAVLTGCGGGGGGSGGGFFPIVGSTPPAAVPDPAPGPVEPPVVDPGPPAPPAGPELAAATALPARVAFQQTIASAETDRYTSYGEPNQLNTWDLSQDLTPSDGGSDQFDGTLELTVEVAGSPAVDFPNDLTYAELTALGPEMGPADGVLGVSFSSDPRYSGSGFPGGPLEGRFAVAAAAVPSGYAYLHSGPEVRLQQSLNLTGATAGTVLTWTGEVSTQTSAGGLTGPETVFQVVVRDTAGAILSTLYRQDATGSSGTWGNASLGAFAGQRIVLSFENLSQIRGAVIDNVSVKDESNVEIVVNGDFESQGTGWTVVAGKVSQNVRANARTLAGLDVQRTFYAQPNQLWARVTDVFSNPGATAIEAVVTYYSNLGSDGAGVIYPTPGADGKALTTWDTSTGDTDLGVVFGTVDTVSQTSTTSLTAFDGSDGISVKKTITVPAGASVTLMNFLLMSATRTVVTATDVTARATEIDTVAADIATNFRTNFLYQRGLTQAQLDTLKNF